MKQKVIVLSMDAMVGEDIEYLSNKPNFSRLFANAARVGKVCTIYPSITYPAHVSIMTGCRAGKHGVVTNGEFKTTPGGTKWHLYADAVQVEDIFAAAKRAGCTTAAVYWPVTGCNPDVDYLINEYFFPDPSEDIKAGFAKFGANDATLAVIRENLHRYPTSYRNRQGKLGLHHTFDDFINGCACGLVRHHQPDLLMVHNCFLDTLRHRHGVFNDYVREGLDQTDLWLGELMDAMEAAGTLETTNFILLSDHGQMDFVRRLKFNVLLRRGGFVDVDENGTVTGWRAFAQSNGMSATVFVKDLALKQQVHAYLKKLQSEEVWGIGKIRTEAEVREDYGMYGDFAFVVETDGYTAFGDGWQEPLVNPVDLSDYRLGQATHGYEPEKGPQPVFVASGPAFRPGAYVSHANVIDEAPTVAAILGAEMPEAEGRCLTELLRPVNDLPG